MVEKHAPRITPGLVRREEHEDCDDEEHASAADAVVASSTPIVSAFASMDPRDPPLSEAVISVPIT